MKSIKLYSVKHSDEGCNDRDVLPAYIEMYFRPSLLKSVKRVNIDEVDKRKRSGR